LEFAQIAMHGTGFLRQNAFPRMRCACVAPWKAAGPEGAPQPPRGEEGDGGMHTSLFALKRWRWNVLTMAIVAHAGGDFPPPGDGEGGEFGGEGDDMYGEGGDEFDNGGYEEGEDEEVVLEPDNPLYARIRAVLEKQLTDQNQRLTEELREKEEELRRMRKKKEDVGVELYGVQQQLARMQLTLEKTHDNFNIVRKLREEAEADAKVVTKEMDKKQVGPRLASPTLLGLRFPTQSTTEE
jgi:hypothetical protein